MENLKPHGILFHTDRKEVLLQIHDKSQKYFCFTYAQYLKFLLPVLIHHFMFSVILPLASRIRVSLSCKFCPILIFVKSLCYRTLLGGSRSSPSKDRYVLQAMQWSANPRQNPIPIQKVFEQNSRKLAQAWIGHRPCLSRVAGEVKEDYQCSQNSML